MTTISPDEPITPDDLMAEITEIRRMARRALAPAVRARQCPLCDTPAGEPCQPKPSGDHLARYLDAYTTGQLTHAYMVLVLSELVVVDTCVVVTIPAQRTACRYCGRTGTRLEARPCCDRPEHAHQQLACADTDDCLAFLLGGAR